MQSCKRRKIKNMWLNFWAWSGSTICKCWRITHVEERKSIFSNCYLVGKTGLDTAKSGPANVCEGTQRKKKKLTLASNWTRSSLASFSSSSVGQGGFSHDRSQGGVLQVDGEPHGGFSQFGPDPGSDVTPREEQLWRSNDLLSHQLNFFREYLKLWTVRSRLHKIRCLQVT